MPAGGLRLINGVIVLSLLLDAVIFGALAIAYQDAAAILINGVLIAAVGLFVWAILPRRLEVWSDSIRIVFVANRAWTIPFETIAAVRPAKTWMAFAYFGVRFATAPSQAVEVARLNQSLFRRPGVIISPESREQFVAAANRALEAWRERAS
jgi:hypothetical protein